MTQEDINYSNNVRNFADTLKDAVVTRVYFYLVLNPTFDKKNIPFEFKYCHSISIVTESEIFHVSTSMNSNGIDTFWIKPSTEIKDSSQFLKVDSKIKNIDIKNGYDNYAFKINIEFEKSNLILFAGEIYDRANGDVDYKINDEMILAFDNVKDAETFEKYITTANSTLASGGQF